VSTVRAMANLTDLTDLIHAQRNAHLICRGSLVG